MKKHSDKDSRVTAYIKKLSNHIDKLAYSMRDQDIFKDYSLINLWIVDFLYDNRHQEIYQKDIEEEFSINRATASKMLVLMEQKNLIHRTTSRSDGRYKELELTSLGKALRDAYQPIRYNVEESLISGLTEEETAIFKVLCRKMLENL